MDTSAKPNYMFSKQYIDYFFTWRWWVAELVFIPMALAFLVSAIEIYESSYLTLIFSFAAGIFIWTFIEYCMHRFLFHFIGQSPRLKHLHYVVHGMHHAYPTDPQRVIFPPFLSFSGGILLFFFLFFFFPLIWVLLIIGW